MNKPPRILRPYPARSGFALVLVISLLALLSMFLIAAETSVLTSLRQVKVSEERATQNDLVNAALARAVAALQSGAANNESAPVALESGSLKVAQTFRRLDAADPVYATIPGITHRAGDALVMLETTERGAPSSQQYLVNAGGARSGALRLK